VLADLVNRRAIHDPKWDLWGSGADIVNYPGANTVSGVSVTDATATKLLAVYASVAFISDTISTMPVEVFRGDTKIDGPAWIQRPTPDLTMPDFIGQAVTSLLLDGNFYAVPVISSAGQVVEVWPIHPGTVLVRRETPTGPLQYYVNGALYPFRLVHVRGAMLPGAVCGMSPITECRQTIGSGMALEDFGARFFGQGSSPSLIIEAPGIVTDDQAIALREQFESFHRGLRKAHGVAVLTGGATARPMTISPDDAQFLESRNFTSAQIAAGLFRLPPEDVGATLPGSSSLTYANITDQWTSRFRRAFLPYVRRVEQMLTELLPRPQIARLDESEFLRADTKQRYDGYAVGIQNGFMTPDYVAAVERLPNPQG
jgi:hypothetical protein